MKIIFWEENENGLKIKYIAKYYIQQKSDI